MEVDTLTLKVEDAARILGISRNTAYSLVAQGQIPAIRLGKRIVVPKHSLERLLDGHWQPSGNGSQS